MKALFRCQPCRWIFGLGVLAFAALAILSTAGFAQPDSPASRPFKFDATHLTQPADLGSTWLVHAGDDPAYARPDFDDSTWMPFDPHTSLIPLFPNAHPEVVWYRQRIRDRKSVV